MTKIIDTLRAARELIQRGDTVRWRERYKVLAELDEAVAAIDALPSAPSVPADAGVPQVTESWHGIGAAPQAAPVPAPSDAAFELERALQAIGELIDELESEARCETYDGRPKHRAVAEVRKALDEKLSELASPAAAAPEPVASVSRSHDLEGLVQWAGKRVPVGTLLYTAAPAVAATVQALTDARVDELVNAWRFGCTGGHAELVRLASAASAAAWGVTLIDTATPAPKEQQ